MFRVSSKVRYATKRGYKKSSRGKNTYKKGTNLTAKDKAYRQGFLDCFKNTKPLKKIASTAFKVGKSQGYRSAKMRSYSRFRR